MNKRLILTFLTAMVEVFAPILIGLLIAIVGYTTITLIVKHFREYVFPIFYSTLFLIGIFSIVIIRFQELNREYMAKAKEVVDILKR